MSVQATEPLLPERSERALAPKLATGVDEVVLAVPAGHRFAARATVALSELEDEPFVEREGGSGTLLSVRRALAERGLSLPTFRVVMVLGSTQAVVSAVEQGHGLGWVSSLAVAHRRPEYVAAVRLAELPIRRTLYLVTPTRRALPAVPAAFVDWLRRERPVPKR
ncbi:MAG: hypothetical protein K6T61_08990 [Bryobacteraceae bacterium]|nr:hypothetical protein [Bryobacteraceae bacterium]